jgi:hypothetical protein
VTSVFVYTISGRLPVEDVKVISHVFLSVLIAGTLWRMVTFHLLASSNPALAHLGKAMTVQY